MQRIAVNRVDPPKFPRFVPLTLEKKGISRLLPLFSSAAVR